MFEIKKGIPVPEHTGCHARKSKYPFHQMEAGDCFDAPRTGEFFMFGKDKRYRKDRVQHNILNAAKMHSRKYGGKFIAHCVDDNTVRVWRVA